VACAGLEFPPSSKLMVAQRFPKASTQEERPFTLIEGCRPTSGSLVIVRAKATRPIGLFDRNASVDHV